MTVAFRHRKSISHLATQNSTLKYLWHSLCDSDQEACDLSWTQQSWCWKFRTEVFWVTPPEFHPALQKMLLYFPWAAVSVPGKPAMQPVGWRCSWFVGLWKSRKGRFLCRFLCTGCPCIWRCIRQSYHCLSFKDDYLKWNLGRTIGVTWPIISLFSRAVYHLRDDLVCYCPLLFNVGSWQFPA